MIDKKKLEELFFNPIISNFKAQSLDDHVINSKKHKIISFEKNFLGIKKNEFKNESEIFLLKHEVVFNLTKTLYAAITKTEPKLLNYFHTYELNWIVFLFNSGDSESIESNYKTSSMPKLPTNIEIVIGVNSGYGESDDPNFYLVLKHKKEYINSFLTIENFRFNKNQIEEFISNGNDIIYLENFIKKHVSIKFQSQLNNFINLYAMLENMKINKKYFVSVCLDLYNRNRSITSMKNDKNLLKMIERLVHQSFDFVKSKNNEITCNLFIDFIIRFNYFPIDNVDITRDKVEELFVQKRAYQKIEDIFPNFKKSSVIFEDYLLEQEETFLKVNKEFNFNLIYL